MDTLKVHRQIKQLKELHAEMRRVALANVYDVPFNGSEVLDGNIVSEKCHRYAEFDGKSYGVVYSLNRVLIPKQRRLLIFLPGRYIERYFWQLTVSGMSCWPPDDLCRNFVNVFFIEGVRFMETTDEARQLMGKMMPKNQRQFTQLIPDTLTL